MHTNVNTTATARTAALMRAFLEFGTHICTVCEMFAPTLLHDDEHGFMYVFAADVARLAGMSISDVLDTQQRQMDVGYLQQQWDSHTPVCCDRLYDC